MKAKRATVLILFVFTMLSMVPPAFAQAPDLDFQQIISALGPRTGSDLVLDILLYLIFGLGFITMLLVPDKQLTPSMMMIAVLFLAVLAKLNIFEPNDFVTFVLNVGMLVLPLLVAGLVRDPRKRPAALIPAALTGLIGGGYFFLFWALKQNVG